MVAVDDDAAKFLNERVAIPMSMRRQFDNASYLPRYRLAESLASQLGLRSDDPPTIIYDFLEMLFQQLATAVRESKPRLDNRGVDIGDRVAERFSIGERLAIAQYYDWLDEPIPKNLTFRMLDAATRQLVGDGIGVYVNQSLAFWAKLGWLGLAASN